MRFIPIAVLFPWLLFEPLFHPMRMEKAVIGMLAAVLSLALAPMASGVRRWGISISVVGALLALSNFVFPDSFAVMTSHVFAGSVLMLTGVLRKPDITYTQTPPVTSTKKALLEQPQGIPPDAAGRGTRPAARSGWSGPAGFLP